MAVMFKSGPAAPKDPTKKRPFFYIMRNKAVSGSPQPDGRGVTFIYESDGRLQSSAGVVGNVTDETMLGNLGKVDTFRKMVHSIGVSVKKNGDPVTVGFAFQMYGHTDPYVSGTTLYTEISSDGMEYVLNLEDYEWSEDDNCPGQIRFEFPEPGIPASVTVAFYLNDGYEAPEQTEDRDIDVNGPAYKAIIEKSLIQLGNTYRVKKAIEKARSGEETTIAFIGGSITQGAGAVPINTECYAYKTFKGFCELCGKSTDENIKYVKAGVGGTPSQLGLVRYERDVLDGGKIVPDVVVVEFAVNDEGDETKGECYDSLVRKIYNGPGKPAVILEYAVFANDWNLEERLCCVGESYNIPMVSARKSVVEQFYVSEAEGAVLSKSQFFYDCFHPTNVGHSIMADGIINMMKKADELPLGEDTDISAVAAPKGKEFENIRFYGRNDIADCREVSNLNIGSFTETDSMLQAVERNLDLGGTPEFADNWMYAGKGDEPVFKATIKCSALMIVYMDSASIEVGTADVYADGEKKISIDPHVVGWTHCNALIVFRGEENKEHNIEVRIPEADRDKRFTILGFGIVE